MKEVFVFGAGASAASHRTPLGHELVWMYYRDCSGLTPIVNGVPDNRAEDIRFSNYKKFLDCAGRIWPDLSGESKEFESRGYYEYTPPPIVRSNKKYYVDELLRILEEKGDKEGTELFKKVIFEHIVGTELTKPNKRLLYETLKAETLKGKYSDDVAIISFNFDFCLYEDFRNEVYFDYLLKFSWIDPQRKDIYKKKNPIPLIKLNGSLDWGICGECRQLHLYFPSIHTVSYEHRCCIGNCGGIVRSYIILPHQKDETIKVLYHKAKSILAAAEKITIIGYSFPDYDKDAINLFKDSMNPNAEIEVIDYYEPGGNEGSTFDRKREVIKKKYWDMFERVPAVDLGGFKSYLERVKAAVL